MGSRLYSSNPLEGYSTVWSDFFPCYSRRTGTKYTGLGSGYATGKGTWSDCGLDYQNDDRGFGDSTNSWGYFLRGRNAAMLAADPTLPPFGMVDILRDGLLLRSTGAYPAVRALLPTYGGNVPYPAAHIGTTWSAKIAPPFARRIRFMRLTGGVQDWIAGWGLGESYAGQSATYRHNETDDWEFFGTQFLKKVKQNLHISDGVTLNGPTNGSIEFDIGSNLVGEWCESIMKHTGSTVEGWMNGVRTGTMIAPVGAVAGDLHHTILDATIGFSWMPYPATATDALLLVRSVEILAPSSNTTGIFPPAPPVPTIAWGGSFTGGSVSSATASGTTIATLSGASTYTVIPYLSTFTGLSVTGSSLKTSGTLSAGTYDFYIEGTDASGVPGIAPKLTATIS